MEKNLFKIIGVCFCFMTGAVVVTQALKEPPQTAAVYIQKSTPKKPLRSDCLDEGGQAYLKNCLSNVAEWEHSEKLLKADK